MNAREVGKRRTRQATAVLAMGSILGVGVVFGVAAADIAAAKSARTTSGTTSGTTGGTTAGGSSSDGSGPSSVTPRRFSGGSAVQPGTGAGSHARSTGS